MATVSGYSQSSSLLATPTTTSTAADLGPDFGPFDPWSEASAHAQAQAHAFDTEPSSPRDQGLNGFGLNHHLSPFMALDRSPLAIKPMTPLQKRAESLSLQLPSHQQLFCVPTSATSNTGSLCGLVTPQSSSSADLTSWSVSSTSSSVYSHQTPLRSLSTSMLSTPLDTLSLGSPLGNTPMRSTMLDTPVDTPLGTPLGEPLDSSLGMPLSASLRHAAHPAHLSLEPRRLSHACPLDLDTRGRMDSVELKDDHAVPANHHNDLTASDDEQPVRSFASSEAPSRTTSLVNIKAQLPTAASGTNPFYCPPPCMRSYSTSALYTATPVATKSWNSSHELESSPSFQQEDLADPDADVLTPKRKRSKSLGNTSGSASAATPRNLRVVSAKEGVSKEGPADKPFLCTQPECGKSFRRMEHLRRHIKVHTQERPYTCAVRGCTRKFSRSDNLKAHMLTHTRQGGRNVYVEGLVGDQGIVTPIKPRKPRKVYP